MKRSASLASTARKQPARFVAAVRACEAVTRFQSSCLLGEPSASLNDVPSITGPAICSNINILRFSDGGCRQWLRRACRCGRENFFVVVEGHGGAGALGDDARLGNDHLL